MDSPYKTPASEASPPLCCVRAGGVTTPGARCVVEGCAALSDFLNSLADERYGQRRANAAKPPEDPQH